MSRVVRSLDAEHDLDDAWDYIAQFNVAAANRLIRQIGHRCDVLATNIEVGEARPDVAPSRRQFTLGNYVILFRLLDDGIELVRVIHASRDLQALFDTRPSN